MLDMFTSREKAEAFCGITLIFALAVVAAGFAWLFGPFGPMIQSMAFKWVVTVIVFFAVGIGLFFLTALINRDENFTWPDDVENWLTNHFEKSRLRRQRQRQQNAPVS